MPLTLVATPIGDLKDISLRALEVIEEADWIVGEDRKPLFRRLKQLGLPTPEKWRLINEHSTNEEMNEVFELCKTQNVALVSDCGTPAFCDPGAELVELCRSQNIKVTSVPGASSLMVFLSLLGERLDQFYFQGFLPRKTEERISRLHYLLKRKDSVILMDTPYRLSKLLDQIQSVMGDKVKVLVGLELTSANEEIFVGTVAEAIKKLGDAKREFVMLLHPPTKKTRPGSSTNI